ncbi:MAG: AAA family ATPase [Myxococcota bacterium]
MSHGERRGLSIARDLALHGAACAVAEVDEDATDVTKGFGQGRPRWRELGAQMAAYAERGDDDWTRLTQRIGLGPVDAWLHLLATAGELYPEVGAALSILAEDERVQLITPATFARLMVSSLGTPYAEALSAAMPGNLLERLGMVDRVELGAARPLSAQPLRLTLAEVQATLSDERRGPAGDLVLRREAPASTICSPQGLVDATASLLGEKGVLALRSSSRRAARQLALDVATRQGAPMMLVEAGEQLPDLVSLARLRGGQVVLDLFTPSRSRPVAEAPLLQLTRMLPSLLVLLPAEAATNTIDVIDAPPIALETAQRAFASVTNDEEAASLARRFRVGLDEVRAAQRGAELRRRIDGRPDDEPTAADVAHELLQQGARRMGRLVTHIPTRVTFDDLVAPPAVTLMLRDIVRYYRAAPRVEADEQLRRSPSLGRGLSCLFAGTPGTGKTFAAQCLASALGLNLYRIDLSQVVSKYIGETEKSLAQVFEEADAGHGILLFDEADALFGKRSEVKDAHDRYANVEVAYLLQRMESFDGVSILTTNLRSNMDPAFVRRMKFIIDLPVPDLAMRARLWERSLPVRSRWARDLDLDPFVERFRLSGGDIHNIGVASAHLAADDPEGLLRPEHVVVACHRELAKAGMSRSPDDFGVLARYLTEELS